MYRSAWLVSEKKTHMSHDRADMCLYVQQFRDSALEVLSCGHYIPHGPTAVSINMCTLSRRSRLTSLSRGVSTHSKVLPL